MLSGNWDLTDHGREYIMERILLICPEKNIKTAKEENDEGKEFLQIIKEPIVNEDGRVRGIIALINNVTEQELLKRELRAKSITDQLTGIYNRQYFDEYLKLLSKDIRYPMTIISADCDNLKMINDSYGHMVGDEYIRLSVTLILTKIPKDASVFRTGGDEFVAFLPGTGKEEARKMIREMKQSALTYQVMGHPLSVSFGSSTILTKEDSVTDCLKCSDKRMYRDKREKRLRGSDKTVLRSAG